MTEEEWMLSADPVAVYGAVSQEVGSPRKLRLATCAWLRSSWDYLLDERSRRAVEVAERLVDGAATDEQRNAAHADAADVGCPHSIRNEHDKHIAYAASAAKTILASKLEVPLSWDRTRQADIFRDIFGNPFRPQPLAQPSLRTWRNSASVRCRMDSWTRPSWPHSPTCSKKLGAKTRSC